MKPVFPPEGSNNPINRIKNETARRPIPPRGRGVPSPVIVNCSSQVYSGRESNDVSWANWSGRVSGKVGTWFEPDSLPDLVNVVKRASHEGRQLRVVGSGWSFENNAYSPEWMVSLRRLKRPLPTITSLALTSEWASRNSLFHIEAGATIAEVNQLLTTAGLALPTMGGANGQALAGAISTGTHGGDINLPPFPDLVMAMHVVTAEGRETWVERASQPITTDGPLMAALPCKKTVILRDDNVFNALLVGLGRFGIIYSYVLQVQPVFYLAEWTVKIPRAQLIKSLRLGVKSKTLVTPLLQTLPNPPAELGTLDAQNPRGLEVVFDTQNLDKCWVKRRWLTNNSEPLKNAYVEDKTCQEGARGVLDQAKHALSAGAMAAGAIVPIAGPIWGIIVATKIAWLEGQLKDNPDMSAGDMLALVMRVAWDIGAGGIIPGRTASEFDARYADTTSTGKRGISHEIISGFAQASLQNCYRADSIEPIFDAWDSPYIDYLESVLKTAPEFDQAGYISLRWSATSKATLSMHNFDSANAVALEITSLRGLPDNGSWMKLIEAWAIARGGRPHWGQINTLNYALVKALYGDKIDKWKKAFAPLGANSSIFSNAFTVQRELEPPPTLRVPNRPPATINISRLKAKGRS
jgi:hypothetical protein